MKTITCDRCGKEISLSPTVIVTVSDAHDLSVFHRYLLERYKDYCDSCLKKVIKEIDNLLVRKE